MYRPPAFREDRRDVLRAAIRAHPLATLVTATEQDIVANVLPFSLEVTARGDVLKAHLARANEQVGYLRAGASALVLFQGPQAYVSPSWYAGKRVHGKVVPTWNYVVVQARGRTRVIDDPSWLVDQLAALTTAAENGQPEPWTVADAPADFIQAQLKGIVGVEIAIDRLEGKWKVSQNRSREDRVAVADGLSAAGRHDMAGLIPLD
ncbi:FMN-binding negative transcriptional regulator [Sphingomonas sp. LR60]|uniref:FMN-binding negative transcriptional regulator n=1 Tax=Sphingomonas sp. LR60 TaxID=3050233 RepID=UPI002FE3DCEC